MCWNLDVAREKEAKGLVKRVKSAVTHTDYETIMSWHLLSISSCLIIGLMKVWSKSA